MTPATLTDTRSFIEAQFPVSKVSKESYKERKSNHSQTLTGLTHGQARSQDKVDVHLNASLTATNLLRLLAARSDSTLGSVRQWAYNRMLASRLFSQLGLDPEWQVSDPEVQPVLHTGRMAA